MSDCAALVKAPTVSVLLALMSAALSLFAVTEPVMMFPPSMTVVVLSICGVVQVTVPPTVLRCVATKRTG